MNESDLVRGLHERNPAAVQSLSDCYLPSLWRFVYLRVGGDRHLAEDIVSETVLALIRAATAPEATIGNLEGWLRSVASNKVVDHFRAAARVQHLIEHVLPVPSVEVQSDPASRQEREEQRAEVRRAMDEMPSRERLVLGWKYLDKLSVREIGRRLQITEKAAESILFRARREFRDRLKRTASDEEEPPAEQAEDQQFAGSPRPSAPEPAAKRLPEHSTAGMEVGIPVNTRDDTAHS